MSQLDNADKLDMLFDMQDKLDNFILRQRGIDKLAYTKDEWLQKKIAALQAEIDEVRAHTNYKWWKNPKPLDEMSIKEELVDVVHFVVSMCLTVDMTSDELISMYMDKYNENMNRQLGLSPKQGYERQ